MGVAGEQQERVVGGFSADFKCFLNRKIAYRDGRGLV